MNGRYPLTVAVMDMVFSRVEVAGSTARLTAAGRRGVAYRWIRATCSLVGFRVIIAD